MPRPDRRPSPRFSSTPWIWVLALVALVLIVLTPFSGLTSISLSDLAESGDKAFIFWRLRVPRTLMAFLAGTVLSLSGLVFQQVFRNSLATPYTLGVSSGASAGIVLGIKFQITLSLFGFGGLFLCGFGGAILSILAILLIARLVRSHSIYTLLMAGVAMNFFFGSVIVLAQYLFDFSQTVSILRWLMGGITTHGYREIIWITPLAAGFFLLILLLRRELVLCGADEDFALSKGLDVFRLRRILFVVVSLITGILVSLIGPVGFVGLVMPHLARLLFRERFVVVVPAAALGGGILLLGADFLSRTLVAPVEIPVGVITSLIGAPFFIGILISRMRESDA